MEQQSKQFEIIHSEGVDIIYDATLINQPDTAFCAQNYHTNRQNQQNLLTGHDAGVSQNAGIGRASVRYFSHEGLDLVYKHYYRGGLIAKFIQDRYLVNRAESTRAFREYRLLKHMQSLDLPVPVAVAACAKRTSILPFYQCDLVTREIKNSKTLADSLTQQALPSQGWQEVGACIRRFHEQNIYHADLNARNIMLSNDESSIEKVYLIDFDKGDVRCATEGWKTANLARLHRSLKKFAGNTQGFCFKPEDWQQLLKAYQEA